MGSSQESRQKDLERFFFFAFVGLIVLNLLVPFFFLRIPPGLGPEGDALDYRLPLINWALRHKSYPHFYWTFTDDYPALCEIFMAVATSLLGNWGPRFVAALGYVSFVMATLRMGLLLLPRLWALAGTLIVASMNLITTQDNLIMNDTVAASFTVWSMYCLLRLWKSHRYERLYLINAGFFAGLALATKYSQIPAVAGLAMLVFLLPLPSKPSAQERLHRTAIFCGMALLMVSPWLIRNLIYNGNPLFPLLYPVLGGKWLNMTHHILRSGSVSGTHIGLAHSPLTFFALPFYFAFYANKFDYSVGPYALAFTPWVFIFIFLARKLEKLLPLVLALTLLLMWFFSSQQGRFLMAAAPVGVFAGIGGMYLWSQKISLQISLRRFSIVFLFVLLTLGTAGTFKHFHKHGNDHVSSVFQKDVVDWVNVFLPRNGALLFMQRTQNLAYMNVDFAFAYPYDYATTMFDYRDYQHKPQEYYDSLRQEGVKYFYFPSPNEEYLALLPSLYNTNYRMEKIFQAPSGGTIYEIKTK